MSEPRFPLVVVEAAPDDADVLVGRLTMLGAECIEERDASTLRRGGARGVTLIASFADDASAEAARDELAGDFDVRLDAVVGDAWRDAWKEHWQPTRITPRIVVVPSWTEYVEKPGDLLLRFDPGRAFGTGQHASTVLAAQAVERAVLAAPPASMIDLGCGSGILAFVALLHGVPRAIACDVDADSVESAAENAAVLGFGERLALRTGGFDAVPETAALVAANIEMGVLVPHAGAVAAKVAAGGRLVLSGILATQRDAVDAAYRDERLVLDRVDPQDEWISLEFVRP